jgi:Holliday junction DNA helicase RuvA
MIGSLRGTVLEIRSPVILVEVHGIGYSVTVSIPTLSSLKVGTEAFFYIHDHVREDARDLYGFATLDEVDFFKKLLGVSGVGPKAALAILSSGPFDQVRRAVMSADLSMLTSVPGVGTKTAQKVVLELKGKLVEEQEITGGDREVVEALVSLGYTSSKAREALKLVDSSIEDTSERIRRALKNLAP